MQPARLILKQEGNLIRFRWSGASRRVSLEFKRELSPKAREKLTGLIARIHKAAAAGGHPSDGDPQSAPDLQSLGQEAFRLAIPGELKTLLRQHKAPLIVSGGDDTFPWELLHDGQEFLGLRIPIG